MMMRKSLQNRSKIARFSLRYLRCKLIYLIQLHKEWVPSKNPEENPPKPERERFSLSEDRRTLSEGRNRPTKRTDLKLSYDPKAKNRTTSEGSARYDLLKAGVDPEFSNTGLTKKELTTRAPSSPRQTETADSPRPTSVRAAHPHIRTVLGSRKRSESDCM